MPRHARPMIITAISTLALASCVHQGRQDASVIPPSETEPAVQEAETRRVPPVMLGVRMAWAGPALASQLQEHGVTAEGTTLLTFVAADTPASRDGLEQWDLILHMDGAASASPEDIRRALQTCRPGDEVAFEVLRGSSPLRVDVTLEEPDRDRMQPLQQQNPGQ
jgi:S1-C subfamily serine protease